MRPRGEIRQAIGGAFRALPGGAGTWLDAAQAAMVGRDVARATCRNMAAAGELIVVGTAQGTSNRPMTVYAPAPEPAEAPCGTDLDAAIRAWHTA